MAFLGIWAGNPVLAASVCGTGSVCEGVSTISLINGCVYDGGAGGCVVPGRYNMEYTCDGDCKYPFTQWECPFNASPCEIKTSNVYLDCCTGGGGGSTYVAPKCSDVGYPNGVLTCESPATNVCVTYPTECDRYFPSKKTVSCGGDFTKLSCQKNCGCCADGDNFSCSNTTYQHTYWIAGWVLNNRGEMVPAPNTFSCRTINDVHVSSLPFNRTTDCVVDRWEEIVQCKHTSVCKTCGCKTPCFSSAPSKPVLTSPVNGTEVTVGSAIRLEWNAITNWGTSCAVQNNQYEVCVSGNQAGCNLVNYLDRNQNIFYNWTPTVADNYVTWSVRANNGALTNESNIRSLCVEGGANISAWSACSNVTHQRTRTCTETCGTDDCAGVAKVETCQGLVRGTLFDASSIDICPSFDPNTGYLIGLPAGTKIASRDFGMTDASNTAPHPWSPLSVVRTNANGNFSINVYPNATYNLNFDLLSDIYVTTPKLTCSGSGTQAVVPNNPSSCLTQPCSVVNNMSFGFTRVFGGWWQLVGGNAHGEKGIRSNIPSSLPTEQSLILPDTAAGNRVGFLSYGVTKTADMLGSNPGAQVSGKRWEKQSSYDGLIYDWGFYNTRFNLFPVTSWNGTDPISYVDGGRGYQIFKADSSVSAFNYNPSGSQKIIIHVNGDFRVTGNIVVPDGAFLMIIAKGAITFGQGVTRADGWYVADTIRVPCKDVDGVAGCDGTDVQFLGNGSFVGWGGLNFSRNLGAANNDTPAEKFSYRQDLFTNAPDPVRVYTKLYKPFIP
ncbi:MAG: hypothetical protein UW64_C0020G0018 [Microgenomates group bacterium GW2011_GWC1_44_37]|uniref:Uncharacterized protein n=1 Tax=Candidatus Collierbacteria bacterium GW2011_GWB2_44_22 TaxID=1618387 RepID=A0A0G1HZC6_9BACT|nr:MAG: hypothetical protein UW31_C0002G0064 [Candidatus Collierbacteria bacterium GW2011_GWA2_44_13]KKT51923.1 MAG: hypothetical protein UW44_C0006G0041 [Candidatus Collierbacteria bacterium GW2011_GWB2_44_22]KKT61219.1 MAG: hypothetical protein UW56_C0030G0002 [Candidatus Collierbacteria bacterium GW2011_GWD1_44_27]KKT68399.1 MAG: hypothetical protein UW64_C0020G0018 [Microgenomates group bacterium GW2011_GWC1_44_37]